MKRVGIGGVVIMDEVEKFEPPRGTAAFLNAEWRELVCFAVAEVRRLRLEINMTNGRSSAAATGRGRTKQ
jgi:hypothetical protein